MIKQYVQNEKFIFSVHTRLGADVLASATAITVKNSTGFVADDFVVVGRVGGGKTEIKKITAITDKTTIDLTDDALEFAHDKYATVDKILYNQRRLYSCATIDGTYVLVATFDIQLNNPLGTEVEDTGTDEFYKVTYYNSETTAETSLDDAEVLQPERTEEQVIELGRYATLEGIRKESGFNYNNDIDNFRISQSRMRAESVVDGYIGNVYSLPLTSVPGIIRLVTEKLASAYLLQEEYGPDSRDTDKDGYKKEDNILKTILSIKNKEILLFDDNGDIIPTSNTQRLKFTPNDNTDIDPYFNIDKTEQRF